MSARRRVVVTGIGTVNPLGNSVPEYWNGLLAGRSGIGRISHFDTSNFKVHFGGEVRNLNLDGILEPREAKRIDRFGLLAVAAAHEAIRDSGLDLTAIDPFRFGVILGSGVGGIEEVETGVETLIAKGPSRVSPFIIPKMIANSASGVISIKYGLRGPNTTVTTACSSAAHALGDAMRQIAYGFADVMISGGTEAGIVRIGLAGFINCKALSENNADPAGASRPFDRDRDGFVLSEGAGILILEEFERAKARGANIYCEILGCGNTADAFHITAPHEDGIGASMAMTLAMKEAGWNPSDVQYVNAHGTSTPLGDAAETKAIKKSFGEHASKLMISSTKSLIGHLLGASGGVEAIATALSLQRGVLHPTINLQNQDYASGCDLDYIPNVAREVRITKAISNSFGFGGHNCSIALGAV